MVLAPFGRTKTGLLRFGAHALGARMNDLTPTVQGIEVKASMFRALFQPFVLLTVALACNTVTVEANEDICGQSTLTESQITSCITSGVNCEDVGSLTGKVQVFEVPEVDADRLQNQDQRNQNAFVEPSLIYFEVATPMSVRFSSLGYQRLFLFQIDEQGVSATFNCVEGSTKWLDRGRYILQSYHDSDQLAQGKREFRSIIEVLGTNSLTENVAGRSSATSDTKRYEKRVVREPEKRFSFLGRLGLIALGIFALFWHFNDA